MEAPNGYEVLAGGDGDGGMCSTRNCPTVYRKDETTFLVQGYTSTNLFPDSAIPEGEAVVAIPVSLIRELMSRGALD